jgi:competence protein ComEA
MKTWQHILLGIILGLLFSAVVYLVAVPPKGTPISLEPFSTPGPITIYIHGSVQQPGVYTLPHISRLSEAVEAAGGMLDTADTSSINLAQRLNEGENIRIPSIEDRVVVQAIQSNGADEKPELTFPININTAAQADLETLPGIGVTRAKDIITYRETNGPFLTIDEIQEVPGIGPATFERLRPLISVAN